MGGGCAKPVHDATYKTTFEIQNLRLAKRGANGDLLYLLVKNMRMAVEPTKLSITPCLFIHASDLFLYIMFPPGGAL